MKRCTSSLSTGLLSPGRGSGRYLSALLTGAVLGLSACSDSADPNDNSGDNVTTGTATMTASTTAGMASSAASTAGASASSAPGMNTQAPVTTTAPAMSSASPPATSAASTSAPAATSAAPSMADTNATMGGSGGADNPAATMTMGTDDIGGAGGMSAGGGGGMSTGGAGGMGTGEPPGDEDLDMTPEDFACIGDWDQVLGFRITNLLGHLDEALEVANSPTGGKYPVGTVIQHLPTEAMVKRREGFSPETKDWEFFILQLSQDGVTSISERGTTEIMTMGSTCASCHSLAPDEWDFICNTWGDNGGDCGFDFDDPFLEMQLAGDTRCGN